MTRLRTLALAAAVSAAAASTGLGAVGDITAVTPAVTGADQAVRSIATGPNGNVWFTLPGSKKIVRMNPQTQAVTQFDLSAQVCQPQGIALGPDGAMWFGCQDGAIGRITTAGAVTYYAVAIPGQSDTYSPVDQVITGPDGNIWFSQFRTSAVGIVSSAGIQRRFTLSSAKGVSGLTVGGDGNVWATNLNKLVMYRITPGGTVTEFPVGTQVAEVATASTGDVWGAPFYSNPDIQVVAPGGAVSALPLGGFSASIARGPLGFMWLGDKKSGRITRVSAAGTATTFSAGITWNPYFADLAAGADGNMWVAGDPNPSGKATLFRVATGAVPTVLVLPSVSGSATAGNTLTADPGAWTYQPGSYAYRWERCSTATSECAVITGATAQRYTVTATDAGRYLRVGVTATNLNGTSARAYSPTIADGDTVTPGGGTATPTAPDSYSGPAALGLDTLLSTRATSRTIVTRYRVGEPGHFSQSARGAGLRLCGTSRDVASAGTYTATCRLSARARAILRTRAIRATVTSTYTRFGLPTAIATVRVTIPRSGVVPPVAG